MLNVRAMRRLIEKVGKNTNRGEANAEAIAEIQKKLGIEPKELEIVPDPGVKKLPKKTEKNRTPKKKTTKKKGKK